MIEDTLRNSSVLVTGGAGFIGSHLVASLLGQGNEVTCLDNFSTGSEKNIQPFLAHPAFRLVKGDIRHPADCAIAVKGVRLVFHQAALGSVPRSVADPHTTHEVNITGFLNMLVAARNARVNRFIYASSSSVYGDIDDIPKLEERTGRPLSPYGFSKLANEHYARLFTDLYGLPCIGLRYFNVFGERQNPAGPYAAAIPRFVNRLLRHEPPEIYGDGTQTRDFSYVGNVVHANHLAAIACEHDPVHPVYNIACGEQISLLQLHATLTDLLGKDEPEIAGIAPVFLPVRPGDIKHSKASISKAEKWLGYMPLFSFRAGMERTVPWYQSHP